MAATSEASASNRAPLSSYESMQHRPCQSRHRSNEASDSRSRNPSHSQPLLHRGRVVGHSPSHSSLPTVAAARGRHARSPHRQQQPHRWRDTNEAPVLAGTVLVNIARHQDDGGYYLNNGARVRVPRDDSRARHTSGSNSINSGSPRSSSRSSSSGASIDPDTIGEEVYRAYAARAARLLPRQTRGDNSGSGNSPTGTIGPLRTLSTAQANARSTVRAIEGVPTSPSIVRLSQRDVAAPLAPVPRRYRARRQSLSDSLSDLPAPSLSNTSTANATTAFSTPAARAQGGPPFTFASFLYRMPGIGRHSKPDGTRSSDNTKSQSRMSSAEGSCSMNRNSNSNSNNQHVLRPPSPTESMRLYGRATYLPRTSTAAAADSDKGSKSHNYMKVKRSESAVHAGTPLRPASRSASSNKSINTNHSSVAGHGKHVEHSATSSRSDSGDFVVAELRDEAVARGGCTDADVDSMPTVVSHRPHLGHGGDSARQGHTVANLESGRGVHRQGGGGFEDCIAKISQPHLPIDGSRGGSYGGSHEHPSASLSHDHGHESDSNGNSSAHEERGGLDGMLSITSILATERGLRSNCSGAYSHASRGSYKSSRTDFMSGTGAGAAAVTSFYDH